MAKTKSTRSTGADTKGPNETAPKNGSMEAANSLPNLDDSALATLTQRIEQKLQGRSGTKKASQKAPERPVPYSRTTKGNTASEKQIEKKQTLSKGKKRNRNGDVINSEEKTGKKTDGKNETLRREILALGGGEEDYNMLMGVDSASELEYHAVAPAKSQSQPSDGILRKELAKMLKETGKVEVEIDEEEDDGNMDSDGNSSDVEKSRLSEAKSAPTPGAIAGGGPSKGDRNKVPKEYSKLKIPPRSDWYNTALPSLPTSKLDSSHPRSLLDHIRRYAMSLLQKENKMYAEIQASSSSSHKFYSTVMASGTLNDKISAFTLAVQESPLHNTSALESLVGLARKRSRAQAVEVLRSLKDLFAQGTLLPSGRKLKAFVNQSALMTALRISGSRWAEKDPLPGNLEPSHLILWAFEDFVKEQYFEILKILELWCNDEIEFSRSKALSYVYELLKDKPEQEANLLRLLVNKLGDPGRKIASRASYLLLQLEQAHPLMKSTIITAIEEVLFRPGQSLHAKYYAVISLNQTILSSKEDKIALQLLGIYFSLFVALLKPARNDQVKDFSKDHKLKTRKKQQAKDSNAKRLEHDDQMREKLISAVLTGVNRAHPFTDTDSDRLSKHVETLYRVTHSSNFNTSVQALMLIQQLTITHKISADRFYRTLYESLLDPRLVSSSKQTLYLNLLYKSLKEDLNVRRVKAFVKRIIQILGLHQPPFICGMLFLVKELEKTFSNLYALIDQPQEDESDEEEAFKDVLEEKDCVQADITQRAESNTDKLYNSYDPRKRDPQHSNADKSCLWELLPYGSHFHPSVSVCAARILAHEPLSGKPDLTLHTLIHFLDRFVYRNPKASTILRGSSLMQPLAGNEGRDLLVTVAGMSEKGRKRDPVNTAAFWQKRVEEVAAEDVFFHEYFNRLGKDKPSKEKEAAKGRGKEATEDNSDNESDIWQALVESKPELEGPDESDIDLDMDDLDSAFREEYSKNDDNNETPVFNDDFEEFEDASDDYDETTKAHREKLTEEQESGDDDLINIHISDEEAFRDSDEDLPLDLDVDKDSGSLLQADGRGKRPESRRRKLKHLPTFASVDDYATLLADEDDGI
ncbi:CBF/Mak21 family domain containing protein [Elaphomyces granulatus]